MAERSALVSAFFEAIRRGNDLAVDTSLAADPTLVRARDRDGVSVVTVALRSNQRKLAERFESMLQATPDSLDIFDAACLGNVPAIRALLQSDRADVDTRGMDGYGPLHLAAEFGQVEVARLLLGRGADPNGVSLNALRAAPLHCAIAAGHRDTAGLLLALGASPNAIQSGGVTALHLAVRNGDEAIVDMLLLRGADATRKSDDGKTPVDVAQESGHSALARLLRTSSRR
jgi:ankyrin repeat protein